jgi:hypothetical protein
MKGKWGKKKSVLLVINCVVFPIFLRKHSVALQDCLLLRNISTGDLRVVPFPGHGEGRDTTKETIKRTLRVGDIFLQLLER